MKKISLLILCLFLSACFPQQQVAQESVEQDVVKQAVVKQEENKDALIRKRFQEYESEIAKNRDIKKAVRTFSDLYMSENGNICAKGYVSFVDITKENINDNTALFAYNIFTEPDSKIECFIKEPHSENYIISSDECILKRRNSKKSTVCYYNYKKYLPADSKIKTDEDFLYLVDAYNILYQDPKNGDTCTFCENLSERTSAEKIECSKKAETFLNQISNKTVPFCKNIIKKEYMDFLQDGINRFSFLSEMTKTEINATTYGAKAYFLNGLYSSTYERLWEDSIKEFGITHFCSVSNYQQDIVNINKKSKQNRNTVVSLN